MNKTLLEIYGSRDDLSEYLFHFTKGSNALNTLNSIFDDKEIKDFNNRGVICFTEAPVILLSNMFDLFDKYDNPMYAPYGIAIKKERLFKEGARPVIYGSLNEKDLLDHDLQWRFEEYEPKVKDFTWLREWRIQKASIELSPSDCFLITNSSEEYINILERLSNLEDVEFDGDVDDGEFHGMATGLFTKFKGITLEDIRKLENNKQVEFQKRLKEQNIDKPHENGLGSFTYSQ